MTMAYRLKEGWYKEQIQFDGLTFQFFQREYLILILVSLVWARNTSTLNALLADRMSSVTITLIRDLTPVLRNE